MMKTISIRQGLLLALCALVLIYSMVQISAVGDHLQYVITAPQPHVPTDADDPVAPNQAILDMRGQLAEQAGEWADTMRLWSVDGAVERATFTSVDTNRLAATGRLTLWGEYGQQLHPQVLCFGRFLYPEELVQGAKVAVLDEQLALALFRVGDPIDREVRIGEADYRVVGVVRHQKRVGDAVDFGAYIPLASVKNEVYALDTLTVEAAPRKGVGASISFRTVTENWQSGGTLIDLGKEGTGAWLWLRVLGAVAGAALLLRAIHALNGSAAFFGKTYRQRLTRTYAVRLMPWAAWRVLCLAAGYACCAAVFGGLMSFILAPVYVFPEWIPSVLVEWNDIGDTFWKVWQGFAAGKELRTPELVRLRFFTLVVDGFSALAGVVLAAISARAAGRDAQVQRGLAAMYREGVAFTTVSTDQPLRFEPLGYVCVTEEKGVTLMRRVVNVPKLLSMLPPPEREGAFVLEITDPCLAANRVRLMIECRNGRLRMRETGKDWDLRLSVEAMARLLWGTAPFQQFAEYGNGCELRMHAPLMDDFFANRLDN